MHHMNSSPSLLTTEAAAPVAPPRRNSSTGKNSNNISISNPNIDEAFIANKEESKNNRLISRPTTSLQLQTYLNNSNSTSNNTYSSNSNSNEVINNSGNIDNNVNRPRKASNYGVKEEKQIQHSNVAADNGTTENIYGAIERSVLENQNKFYYQLRTFTFWYSLVLA